LQNTVIEPGRSEKKSEPRYAELARQLVHDISAGILPAGASLPGEFQLAEQHGVSRGTVRAALRMVQDLGLVSRKKRAGTRVERSPVRREYSPAISTIAELAQYGEIAKRTVHWSREVLVDRALSRRLGLPVGTRWLHLGTSRAHPDVPRRMICWSDIYVELEAGNKICPLARHSDELVCDLVRRTTGRVAVKVEQRIRAMGVPAKIARRLGTEPGTHALEFTRHYLDQSGALMVVAVAVHPADRFAYFTTLQRLK
jgi:DNA-binding GntR family transcriptional regulator